MASFGNSSSYTHGLNDYIDTKAFVCFPLKITEYLAVILSLSGDPILLLSFSFDGKHTL
jgi:hypothetical protein